MTLDNREYLEVTIPICPEQQIPLKISGNSAFKFSESYAFKS